MPREPVDQEQDVEHVEDEIEEVEGSDEAGEEHGEDARVLEGQDEAEDDEEDGAGSVDPDDEPPARKPNRASARIQTLTTTAKEAKEKADRLERELGEIRARERQREQQATQESPADRAARRALMDPLDVMREDLQESERRTQTLLHQQAMGQRESSDRTEYEGILRERPNLKKFEAEVEKVRQEQAANGAFVPRKVLLELAVGRAALAAASAGGPKAKAKATQRVDAQRARPSGSKGDTATVRGKQGKSLEDRLGDVPI